MNLEIGYFGVLRRQEHEYDHNKFAQYNIKGQKVNFSKNIMIPDASKPKHTQFQGLGINLYFLKNRCVDLQE